MIAAGSRSHKKNLLEKLPRQEGLMAPNELICYCFQYTRPDIENDVKQNGRSLILERIVAAKRLGACKCALLNPKGT
jgi:hypothetical protein